MLIDYHQHEEPPPVGKGFLPWQKSPTTKRGFPHGQQWLFLFGALLFLIAFINLCNSFFPPRFRRLVQLRPLPIDDSLQERIARRLSAAARPAWRVALSAYRTERWETALNALERVRRQTPSAAEIDLLAGIAELELNRAFSAITDLKAAQKRLPGTVREYCEWNLAQAYLLREKPEQAVPLLTAIARRGGGLSQEAANQLAQIRALLSEND